MKPGVSGETQPDLQARRPDRSSLSTELAEAFTDFLPAYRSWSRHRLPHGAPSPARLKLIRVLYEGGPRIMRRLSEDLAVTPRDVTGLVDALETEGLLLRRPHPEDRRAVVIELTGAGEKAYETYGRSAQEAAAPLFYVLTKPERRELLRLLGELRQALQKRPQ